MITIQLAGVNVGIQNQYDLTTKLREWITDAPPEFTVQVSQEEIEREGRGEEMSGQYREFVCVYRHIAERMPDYDAFVFHGAAVAMEGRCFLFTAPSGTGKTTHVRNWVLRFPRKAYILNGDKPILRRTDRGFRVYGTPWRGKENQGYALDLPIQGICLLHRGTENRIQSVEGEELVRFLLRQVYLPKDPGRLARLLELLDACCREVPAYTMTCTPDPISAQIAWEAMQPK